MENNAYKRNLYCVLIGVFYENFYFFVVVKDSILDNGRTASEKEEVNKSGVMAQNMKDIGIMIWLTAWED